MKHKSTKVTFIRNPETNRYEVQGFWDSSDDELFLVKMYFDSCVRYNPINFLGLKKLIMEGIVGCNELCSEIIDGKFQLYHNLIKTLKEPRLSHEELLSLVQKWYELIEAKVDKIVITNNNGTFSIGAE